MPVTRNMRCFVWGTVLLTLLPVLSAEAQTSAEPGLESMFYSQAEVNSIRDALTAYLNRAKGNNVSAAEYLNNATEIKKIQTENRYFTYPQFFLESLVYHSSLDWSIWVSGKKITAEYPAIEGELKVTAIDKERVSFEWIPVDMKKVMEIWDKWPNDDIKVDEYNKTVSFTLLPNQTFSSYVMRVLEGKVMPVTVGREVTGDELLTPKEVTLPVPEKKENTEPELMPKEQSTTEPAPEPDTVEEPLKPKNVGKEVIGLFDKHE